jgi:hypothetical protein
MAKVEVGGGLGWHSLRRAFATDLSDVPLKVLCELGGWKDPNTILKCYQQPDLETQRRALSARTGQTGNQLAVTTGSKPLFGRKSKNPTTS